MGVCAILFSLLLLVALRAEAQLISVPFQVDAGNTTGVLPGHVYGGLHENIDLGSGGLNITVPLVSFSGRAGNDLGLDLHYSSKFWNLTYSTTECPYNPMKQCTPRVDGGHEYMAEEDSGFPLGYGWTLSIPLLSYANADSGNASNPAVFCYENFVLHDSDGSKHAFSTRTDCADQDPPPYGLGWAPTPRLDIDTAPIDDPVDATFMRLEAQSIGDVRVYRKDGSYVEFGNLALTSGDGAPYCTVSACGQGSALPTKIVDRNGNYITLTQSASSLILTDSVGRTVSINYGSTTTTGGSLSFKGITSITYQNPESGGSSSTQTISFGYTMPTQTAPASLTPASNYSQEYFPYSIGSITYPKGLQYTFEYDTLGEMTKVTYPTGGYSRYDWGVFQHYQHYQWNVINSPEPYGYLNGHMLYKTIADTIGDFREVTAVHECSSSSECSSSEEQTTAYTPSVNGTVPNNIYMDVTTPDGVRTRHSFNNDELEWYSGREMSHTVYNPDGSQAQQVSTTYTDTPPAPWSMPSTITTTTYTANGGSLTSMTQKDYNTVNVIGGIMGAPNAVPSNIKETREYDFGASTPTRTTVYTWKDYESSNQWFHLYGLLGSTTVHSGSDTGPIVSQTTNTYDGSTLTNPGVGAANHDDVNDGVTYTTRGNLTSVTKVNSLGNSATTQYAYDIYGNRISTTDPNRNITSYQYTDLFGDATCATGTPFYSYVSGTVNPLGYKTSRHYNSCSGTISQIQGPNDLAANRSGTQYIYDALNNVVNVSYPDGGSEELNYHGYALPLTITSTMAAAPDPTMTVTKIMDGIGRVVEVDSSDPAGTDITTTTYDWAGRTQTQSNPHRSTASTTDGITTHSYDAFGRTTRTQNPDGSFKQWCYDGISVYGQTNCSSTPNVGTNVSWVNFSDENGNQWQNISNGLGRLLYVIEPGSLQTAYSYDVLGNLLKVVQFGNGTSDVARVRTFNYDSLSRLLCASNAENSIASCPASNNGYVAGTTGYSYDANSNLLAKTDARGVTTNYIYDQLNRLASETYTSDASGTPISCFQYDLTSISGAGGDLIGRLTNAWTQSAKTSCPGAAGHFAPMVGQYQSLKAILAYDAMGRETAERQCTPSNCNTSPFSLFYSHDLAGNLTSYTNGIASTPGSSAQPLTFSLSFSSAGLLQNLLSNWSDKTHPPSLFAPNPDASSQYTAQGALANALVGTGLTVSKTHDSRTRVTESTVVSAANGTIYRYSLPSYVVGSIPTGYDAVGNVVGYSELMQGPTTSGTTTDNWTFTIDALSRLTSAANTEANTIGGSQTSNFCYAYDSFGNRTLNYGGACASGLPQLSYNASNHSASGLQVYDSAGNVTADSNTGNTYLYDGAGQVCAVKNVSVPGNAIMTGYVYNADGDRVAKGSITAMSCDPASNGLQTSSETDYVIGPGGEQLTEMSNGGTTWNHTNIFAGGELIGTYDTSGLHFYANDWLGNRRLQTGSAGAPEQTCGNLPFGDGLNCSASITTPTEHHFTGKERDTESGNDYFDARYYASSLGRFLSPDWSAQAEPVPYAKLDNPQSLNLYSYVMNNPLSRVDPDGHNPLIYGSPSVNTGEYHNCDSSGTCMGGPFGGYGAEGEKSYLNYVNASFAAAQQQNNGALAGEAANAQGSQHWDVANQTKIAAGKDKCNEFVGDMIEGVGRARPRVKYTDIRGWLFGMTRDPSAKEWATADIPGYSAPMPVSSASKGDIVAVGHSGNGQGHVGIYVGGSGVASANWYQGGAITINNWGFRPAGQNDEGGGTVVVRKWLGDQ